MRGLPELVSALALCALLSAVAVAAAPTERVNGGGFALTGIDRRNLSVAARDAGEEGSLGIGVVQLVHHRDSVVVGRFNGAVTCVQVVGTTAYVSGVIRQGESAALGSLDGRSYRTAIADGDRVGKADTFTLQIARPGYTFPSCSLPAPDPNAGPLVGPLDLDGGNYVVGK